MYSFVGCSGLADIRNKRIYTYRLQEGGQLCYVCRLTGRVRLYASDGVLLLG